MHSIKETIAVLWYIFYIITAPRGTTDDAASIVRAHRAQIGRIEQIVASNLNLRRVAPRTEPNEMAMDHGTIKHKKVSDDDEIAGLLANCHFGDLVIIRKSDVLDDQEPKDPNGVTRISIMILEPGWFGSTMPVAAVWFGPHSKKTGFDRKMCKPVEAGWFVCPFPA